MALTDADGTTVARSGGSRTLLLLIGLLSFQAIFTGCVRPRIPTEDTRVRLLDAEQIVVGRVESVSRPILYPSFGEPGMQREDVCLTVFHVLQGKDLPRLCFVQFVDERGLRRHGPPPALEVGQHIVAFLSMDGGLWRPKVDVERVWIELGCAADCREPLVEPTLRGKLAEIMLRRTTNARYPEVPMSLKITVLNARKVAGEPFVRRAVERLAREGTARERSAACGLLQEEYRDHLEGCFP